MAKDENVRGVTAERRDLLAALAVSSVVEARNTIPILENMIVEAAGGMLRMTATDIDMAVSVTVPAAGGDFVTTDEIERLRERSVGELEPIFAAIFAGDIERGRREADALGLALAGTDPLLVAIQRGRARAARAFGAAA